MWRWRHGDVHNDLAGALHDVGIVEALVALTVEPARARLGDPVMFSPFLVGARVRRVRALSVERPRRRVSRSSRRSVRRSVWRNLSGEKEIRVKLIN